MSGEKDGVQNRLPRDTGGGLSILSHLEVVYTVLQIGLLWLGMLLYLLLLLLLLLLSLSLSLQLLLAVVLTIVRVAIVIVLVAAVVLGAVEVDSLPGHLWQGCPPKVGSIPGLGPIQRIIRLLILSRLIRPASCSIRGQSRC